MNRKLFNDNWDFALLENADNLNDWDLGVAWSKVTLPHDFSISGIREPHSRAYRDGGYFPGGFGIYRKTINMESDDLKRVWHIEFEGIYHRAQVRINGNVLGFHPYGYTSFYYDLTPYLTEGENEILVYVDNTCLPHSRWYSGSGIYRNVWLCDGQKLHIKTWGVTVSPIKTGNNIGVGIDTKIDGDFHGTLLRHTIFNKDKEKVAVYETKIDGDTVHAQITVPAAILWDTDNPYLYSLKSEIVESGKTVDTYNTSFGLRFISVDAKRGLQINGKTVKLKGGCVHHDNGIIGAASYAHSEERKVRVMKQNGFNAIRCAHNPPSPAFLDACDKLGMLVMDEAFDVWTRAKKRYDYHVFFPDWWQRDLESMVLRDFNHPSVIIWSIGNEIPEQTLKSGEDTTRRLVNHIRSIDSTRPVTQAVDNPSTATDPTFDALDICGYNYGYKTYETDIKRVPDRVIMGTESVTAYGFENWYMVEKYPNVIGDFVWTSLDYLGEAALGRSYYPGDKQANSDFSPYPWNKAYCGDIDLLGHKRTQSYFRDILWGRRDTPYIAVRVPVPQEYGEEQISYWGWNDNLPSWDWKGYEGKTMLVDVYSLEDAVELFINGRSLGVKNIDIPNELIITDTSREETKPGFHYSALFEVPYETGELTAITKSGKKFSICTSGDVYKLRITPDKEELDGIGDILFADIDVVDQNGNIHYDYNDEICVTVSGGMEILGIGNANPKDEEPFIGNTHRAWRGKLQVAIRCAENANGTLEAKAQNIPATAISIETIK